MGTLALIIPGLYVLVRYSQIGYVAAFESVSIGETFQRSSELTAGRRWTIFGRFVGLLVILAGELVVGTLLYLGLTHGLVGFAYSFVRFVLLLLTALAIEMAVLAWSYELYVALR